MACYICFGQAADSCPRCWKGDNADNQSEHPETASTGIDTIVDASSWKWIQRYRESVKYVMDDSYSPKTLTILISSLGRSYYCVYQATASRRSRALRRGVHQNDTVSPFPLSEQRCCDHWKPGDDPLVITNQVGAKPRIFSGKSTRHSVRAYSNGLFLLDPSVKIQDDLNLAFKPGLRTLRDYGISTKR